MTHSELVLFLRGYVIRKWEHELRMLFCDHNELEGSKRPPKVNGHIPDVYAQLRGGIRLVGEAKTPKDFRTDRSQKQLECFLRYVSEYNGIFVLAVPFLFFREAVARVEYIARIEGYTIQGLVIHEIGTRELRCND